MNIVIDIILLLIGFVLLIRGADVFVDGSSAVAKRLRVPSVVVGLTVVAIGTSLPELAVSTLASFRESNAIALGNVVGSNIFNFLMVIGITALFVAVPVRKSIIKRDIPFLLVITLLLLFLAGDVFWSLGAFSKFNPFDFGYNNLSVGKIGRIDGILLLILFVFYLCMTVWYALRNRENATPESKQESLNISKGKCAVYIIGGVLAIAVGGEAVVEGARNLALAAGMGETLVGLTVVAFGTSLPELVTSAVAGRKGETEIAVGNVVGSSIANILLVLGVSAVVSPVNVSMMSLIDILISFVIGVLVLALSALRHRVTRVTGVIFILIYAAYMAYIVCRQFL